MNREATLLLWEFQVWTTIFINCILQLPVAKKLFLILEFKDSMRMIILFPHLQSVLIYLRFFLRFIDLTQSILFLLLIILYFLIKSTLSRISKWSKLKLLNLLFVLMFFKFNLDFSSLPLNLIWSISFWKWRFYACTV